MRIHKLASLIANREGKRSQVKIGDIREILSIICDIIYTDKEITVISEFIRVGQNRANHRQRKYADKTTLDPFARFRRK